MKKNILLLLSTLCTILMYGQVGIGTSVPNNSAALDITSTSKGLLIPRVTQAQKNSISSPATGLLVFQTDALSGFWYFNGAVWTPFGGSNNSWSLTTNTGTNPASNKLGTLDNNPIVFKTNTIEASRISPSGNVGINIATPLNTKLTVNGASSPAFFQDFEFGASSNFPTSSANPIYWVNNNNAACTATQGWRVSTSNPLSTTCGNCTGYKAFINSAAACTSQDATLVVKIGSFAENKAVITFNFAYNYFDVPDSFTVTLYNETTNSVALILVKEYGDVTSSSIEREFQNYYREVDIIPGNQYSLRYRYVAAGSSYGALVDNIRVLPFSPSFRLEDGNQGIGKVLITDANGNATWTYPSAPTTDDDWIFNSGSEHTDPIYRIGNTKIAYSGTARALLDVFNNQGTGSKIGIGSKEFVSDGTDEFMLSNSLIPSTDNSLTLGTPSKRWRQIIATNGIITTSDQSEKTNITPLVYNLNDFRKLKPVSYYWKKDKDKTADPERDQRQIGFIAQDLLETLPETVQNEIWVTKNNHLKKVNAENLTVAYSELLPVTVKAIQEHQVMLSELEKEIDQLLETTKKLKK